MYNMNGEQQYLNLLQEALYKGYYLNDPRTGSPVYKTMDHTIRWGKEFPFCTIRPLGIKNAWEEMRLFLSGNPDTKVLEEKGITFWVGNTSREFLDKQGLHHLPEGSLGKAYSHQFRNAGGTKSEFFNIVGTDQLQNLIDGLRSQPYSRRHAIDLWGVAEQDEMPLLPCWYRSSWYCTPAANGRIELHVKLHNRSLDIVLGYFQAAMQYKLFQIALCKLLDYDVGNLTTDHVDCHVYANQVLYANAMLQRPLGVSGTVRLDKEINSIEDVIAIEPHEWIVEGYEPNRATFTSPRPEMVA